MTEEMIDNTTAVGESTSAVSDKYVCTDGEHDNADSPVDAVCATKNSGTIDNTYSSKNRLPLVDNIRGLVIFLTVVTWYIGYFPFMPWWFPHFYSARNGIGVADLGVVLFSFILSFMMSYNFRKRAERDGNGGAIRHFLNRGIMMIAVGFTANYFRDIFYSLEQPSQRFYSTWNMIVTYGVCTLLMLPILTVKKTETRIYIGFALLVLYQVLVLHIMPLRQWIWKNDQGGLIGAISFLGLMLISSGLGDFYFREKRKFFIASAGIIGIGLILIILNIFVSGNSESWDFFSFIFMDKMYQTAGYMIGSLAITLVIFIGFDRVPLLRDKPIPLFNRMGQNSIVFYAVGAVLLGIAISLGKPIPERIMVGATFLDMLIGLSVIIPPMLILAFYLQKKNFRFSL